MPVAGDTPSAICTVSARDLVGARDRADALMQAGVAHLSGPFPDSGQAFDAARAVIEAIDIHQRFPALETIGAFVISPVEGPPSRDFQTLHFDFGLPLDPARRADVPATRASTSRPSDPAPRP